MKTTVKLCINSMLNKQRAKEGKYQIFVRITLDGKRSEISTRHYICLKDWDEKQFRVKDSAQYSHLINVQLEEIKNEIKKHNLKLQALEEEITIHKLRNLVLGKPIEEEPKPKHKTICEAFDYHNLRSIRLPQSKNGRNIESR